MTSASKTPEKYGIQAVPHRRFGDMFACRIHVPFEGTYWLVNAQNAVDVFKTSDEATAAGARALLPILNRKIKVHRPGALEDPEKAARNIARHGKEGIEFHFFAAHQQ